MQGELTALFKVVKDASYQSTLESIRSDFASITGSIPKISFDKWLSAGGETEAAGEKIGTNLGKGIKKSLTGNLAGLIGQFGSVVQKGQKDSDRFWNDAIKIGKVGDKQQEHDKNFLKNMLVGGVATLFNPFVGARMMSDTIGKSSAKGSEKGIFGAAGAMGYGEIFIAVKTLETVFKLLAKAVMNTLEAYETARKLYAKSLLLGLGLNFTAKRGMLAEVLGVGETEVMRFGLAMNYLNPRLAFAVDTLARTAIPLTGVSWEFKILEENLKALWATIAEGVTPSVKSFMVNLNDFISVLGQTGVLEGVAMVLDKVLQTLSNMIGFWEVVVNGFVLGLKTIADAIALMIVGIINLIAKIPGAGKLGIHPLDSSGITDDLKKSYSAFGKEVMDFFKNFNGGDKSQVPPPMSQMKQLPASAWEKMGLVIGGGQADKSLEVQRRTAHATEGMYKLLQKLNQQKQGFYMGRNPTVAGF